MSEDKLYKIKRLLVWVWEHGLKFYFGLALLLVVFGYGFVVGKFQVYPYSVVSDAKIAAIELRKWLELYLPLKKQQDHPHVILWPGLAPNEKTL